MTPSSPPHLRPFSPPQLRRSSPAPRPRRFGGRQKEGEGGRRRRERRAVAVAVVRTTIFLLDIQSSLSLVRGSGGSLGVVVIVVIVIIVVIVAVVREPAVGRASLVRGRSDDTNEGEGGLFGGPQRERTRPARRRLPRRLRPPHVLRGSTRRRSASRRSRPTDGRSGPGASSFDAAPCVRSLVRFAAYFFVVGLCHREVGSLARARRAAAARRWRDDPDPPLRPLLSANSLY